MKSAPDAILGKIKERGNLVKYLRYNMLSSLALCRSQALARVNARGLNLHYKPRDRALIHSHSADMTRETALIQRSLTSREHPASFSVKLPSHFALFNFFSLSFERCERLFF